MTSVPCGPMPTDHDLRPVEAIWEADDRAEGRWRVTVWSECERCGKRLAALVPLRQPSPWLSARRP